MSDTKQCLVCNKTFVPCHTCESLGLASWRTVVCCREHFILNQLIADYLRKQLTKSECKARLNEYFKEFGNVDFNDNVKSVIDEILAEDIIKVETKAKTK